MTSRFPPILGKIATSLYKIIAGDSQTHIILGSGTQTREDREKEKVRKPLLHHADMCQSYVDVSLVATFRKREA